jgi:hypothetical protein
VNLHRAFTQGFCKNLNLITLQDTNQLHQFELFHVSSF